MSISKKTAKSSGKMRSDAGAAWGFLSPWIIGFLIFSAFPLAFSFYLSLTKWNLMGDPQFVGLQNYKDMLSGNGELGQTLLATAIFTVINVSVSILFSLLLAFRNFGMLDSFWPLILPSFFAQPYNVFLFRQFFVSIPDSIDEAAMLDGCSRWQAFWKVIVPLGKPIFITVGIMSASFWWNELFSPLVYINSEDLKPLTLGVLTSFVETSAGASKTMWNLQMAFSMLMIIPPALLYICCSKYITEGIKTSGMKD